MKYILRIMIYFFGLFIITIGINLSIVSGLGISPVSAFTLPISKSLNMSLGAVTTCAYVVFVFIQYLLLKEKFKKRNILQIPFSIAFGFFVDFTGSFMNNIELNSYGAQFLVLIFSIIICAVGATLYIVMDIVPNAHEGLQLSVCERFNLPFSKVKIASDCIFVFIGFMITFLFLEGNTAIREGTILSALLTGKIIGVFSKKAGSMLKKIAFYDQTDTSCIR